MDEAGHGVGGGLGRTRLGRRRPRVEEPRLVQGQDLDKTRHSQGVPVAVSMPCSTLASIKMASSSRTSLGVSSHKACGALPQRPATWLRSSCHLFRFSSTEAELSRVGGLGSRRLLFPLLPHVLRRFHDCVEGLRSRMAYEQLPSSASAPHLLRLDGGQGAAAPAAEAALHVPALAKFAELQVCFWQPHGESWGVEGRRTAALT